QTFIAEPAPFSTRRRSPRTRTPSRGRTPARRDRSAPRGRRRAPPDALDAARTAPGSSPTDTAARAGPAPWVNDGAVHEIELLVFLLLAVAVLAGIGLRLNVPYPVVLVVGGLVIGLVPGLPSPRLDPDLVLFAFLPPLLYSAGVSASAFELRDSARPILWLATGLGLAPLRAVPGVPHPVLRPDR